ncbi:MAG: bifunctional glutamate N-acetyltransferase/amino-acid acetyltransferase ArgJ [Chloroflexota bacterium]
MSKDGFDFITGGSVTSPEGFRAGAISAGISRLPDKLDLGILCSDSPCSAAGVFTRNRIQAAPVVLSRKRLEKGRAVAIVAVSGCANAFTGAAGLADAEEMAQLAAAHNGLQPSDILVASTGVIGTRLPMVKIRQAIGSVVLKPDGGHDLARAIMTTDTVPKEAAVRVGGKFTIGGIAKGSGMIHPDMGTLLCFVATDARVGAAYLKKALVRAVDISFNMVSVDGDTSTNDTVFLLANGRAPGAAITEGSPGAEKFQESLEAVCTHLARGIARDGEGATRLFEFTVEGAPSLAEAKLAARTVVSSPLVKSAVHGSDPNWGRIMAAVGRSGAAIEQEKVDLKFGEVYLIKSGALLPYDHGRVVEYLKRAEVSVTLDLHLGTAGATAWGCDLSQAYVAINGEYTS